MWSKGGSKGGVAGAAPRTAASVAAEEKTAEPALTRAREVHLDGLAVLKIIKHCQDHFPESVAGSLLGMGTKDALEVTHRCVCRGDGGGGGGAYMGACVY